MEFVVECRDEWSETKREKKSCGGQPGGSKYRKRLGYAVRLGLFLFLGACGNTLPFPGLSGNNEKQIEGKVVFYQPGTRAAVTRRAELSAQLSETEQMKMLIEQFFHLPVRNIFLLKNGLLLLDFEKSVKYNQNMDVEAEVALCRSLIQTLMQNDRHIQTIQFLIGGQEDDTWIGHVDISRPLTLKDVTW